MKLSTQCIHFAQGEKNMNRMITIPEKKISLIVPVYNVAPFLKQCVTSILKQTYTNLEIILIDDGSTDESGKICDEIALTDYRIKVIHKENGGLSDARNAGLAIASGQYIGFVDSDDWISKDMYEKLYRNLCNTQSDISACGVEMFWPDGSVRTLTSESNRILENMEAMEELISEKMIKQPVWYKLYKSELIKGCPFEKGKYHEDMFWTYKIVAKAKRICVFSDLLYHYRQRNNSIMGNEYSIKRLDIMEAKNKRYYFIKKEYPSLLDLTYIDLFFSGMFHIQSVLKFIPQIDQDVALDTIKYYMDVPHNSTVKQQLHGKQTLWYCIGKRNIILTCKLRNILHIGI